MSQKDVWIQYNCIFRHHKNLLITVKIDFCLGGYKHSWNRLADTTQHRFGGLFLTFYFDEFPYLLHFHLQIYLYNVTYEILGSIGTIVIFLIVNWLQSILSSYLNSLTAKIVPFCQPSWKKPYLKMSIQFSSSLQRARRDLLEIRCLFASSTYHWLENVVNMLA